MLYDCVQLFPCEHIYCVNDGKKGGFPLQVNMFPAGDVDDLIFQDNWLTSDR